MSDPEPVKEEIMEETVVPVEESTGITETGTTDESGSPAKAAPDAGQKKKRTSMMIVIGVIVVLIVAVIGAFFLLSGPVATKGDIVAVYFNESFENGTLYESNMNTSYPLVFTIGNSSVILGVQEAVTGMSLGQVKTVTIPEAYGAYDPGLVQTVNRTGPIANATFVVGQFYTVRYRTTNSFSTVKILNVTPATITWDANNPLVGQNLTFTIKLANITQPNSSATAA